MFRLRFFDDYGSGRLWPADDATRAAFDLRQIDDRLAHLMSPQSRALAERLSLRHVQSMIHDYPPDGCLWPDADCPAFDDEVETLFQQVQADMGGAFTVSDQRMILRKAAK